MSHKIGLIYSWFVRTILFFLPDIPLFMRFRGWCYSLAMKKTGKNFQVSANTILKGLPEFEVGANVYLAPGVIINAATKIKLEDEVMFGFNVVAVSGNHTIKNGSYRFGVPVRSPITIGYGSWIAANCTITAGSIIGSGCLIAANSVVIGTLEKNGKYGGVPSRKIS